MKNTLICNIFGSPGSGKSTLAAGLFYFLKREGINCENLVEFAKILTWSKRFEELKSQPYVFGKQLIQIDRLLGQVDVIITDSPILLSSFYSGANYPDSFRQSILDIYKTYNNYNLFITREKPYNPKGRNQTEKESDIISQEILDFLNKNELDFEKYPGNIDAEQLSEKILERLSL